MIAPFKACQIKIERAKRHLAELTSEIDEYFRRDAVEVIYDRAPEFGDFNWKTCAYIYREKEPVPLSWSAIVGDVIHNLRTSLDVLATDLHRVTGGKPGHAGEVYYPFCKSQSDFPDTLRKRRLSGIGPAFTKAIEQTAPYKGGNEGLRAIHDLDILDKHQALVRVVSVVSVPWPVPIKEGDPIFRTGVVRDGQRLIVIPCDLLKLPTPSKVEAEFSILIGAEGPFKNSRLVHQLEACVRGVEGILALFLETARRAP